MRISSFNQKELSYHVEVAVKAVLMVPELEAALNICGLSPDKAKVGLSLKEEVIQWQEKQEACYRNAIQAQRTLGRVRETIDSIYIRHRTAARFVYREDEDMLRKLHLQGSRRKRYTGWLDMVQKFYLHLDAEVVVQFGILPEEVNEVKTLLSQLSQLHVLRNDSRRQAQQATEVKQKAVTKLRHWFRYFISTAELACKDNPYLLEAMGAGVYVR